MAATNFLLGRCGVVDPSSLDAYAANGGLAGLRRAREIGPAAIVDELTSSELVGRGGAAFPTGRKWAGVAAARGRKYVICNADESEPGTFKDRKLLEEDPFAIVEAMLIAAWRSAPSAATSISAANTRWRRDAFSTRSTRWRLTANWATCVSRSAAAGAPTSAAKKRP